MLDDPTVRLILALFPLYLHQLYLSRKIGRFSEAIKMLQANQQSMHDYHLANPNEKDDCQMCHSQQSEQHVYEYRQ